MGRGCLDVSWAGETGGEGVVFLGRLTVVCVEMCVQRDGGQIHMRTHTHTNLCNNRRGSAELGWFDIIL